MLFGFCFMNRKYSPAQLVCASLPCLRSNNFIFLQVSILLVSFGVIVSTVSKPAGRSPPKSEGDYSFGVILLTISLFLTGFMGMLQERTYRRYGACWQEGLFYT